jgi:phosphatidylglycerol:prolipoprotein diacylglycerol transferase
MRKNQAPLMNGIAFPNIDPVAFAVGPLEIRWYGISYVIGILLAWWYARHLADEQTSNKFQITRNHIDDYIIWAAIGMIFGGRIGYILFYDPIQIIKEPWEMLYIWMPGRSFHGGLLGVAIATFLFCNKRKIQILPIADICACVSPIGLFFGRIANFINAELYGRVTDAPWGVVFPDAGPLPRHPSQLYEAALEGIVLFFILFGLERFTHVRRERPGLMFAIFMIGYSMARVGIEFFRQPDVQIGYLVGGSTMGQLLSTPLLLTGLILTWHVLTQPKHH